MGSNRIRSAYHRLSEYEVYVRIRAIVITCLSPEEIEYRLVHELGVPWLNYLTVWRVRDKAHRKRMMLYLGGAVTKTGDLATFELWAPGMNSRLKI